MGGAGIVGSGGIGVGGWQIYEEVNPTLDRQLSRDKYIRNFIGVPVNDSTVSDHKKFTFSNWGCVTKLFPNLSINHTETTTPTVQQPTSTQQTKENNNTYTTYFSPPSSVSDNFVVCALLDLREGDSNSKNKAYFKAEVAFRDQN